MISQKLVSELHPLHEVAILRTSLVLRTENDSCTETFPHHARLHVNLAGYVLYNIVSLSRVSETLIWNGAPAGGSHRYSPIPRYETTADGPCLSLIELPKGVS